MYRDTFRSPPPSAATRPRRHLPDLRGLRFTPPPQSGRPAACPSVLGSLSCPRSPHAALGVSRLSHVPACSLVPSETQPHRPEMALLSTAQNQKALVGPPPPLLSPDTVTLKDPVTFSAHQAALPLTKHSTTEEPTPVTLAAKGGNAVWQAQGALCSGSCPQWTGARHGTAAYLRQDVLLVVRLVLQGVALRGSPRLRARGLAGARRGAGGHAARSHTQSEAEDQRQKPGHEGRQEGARAPWENGWGPGPGRGWGGRASGWDPEGGCSGRLLQLGAAERGRRARPGDPGHLLRRRQP